MTKHLPRGLDNRARDQNPPKAGEIREKRSDTKVETLRDEYGAKFAPGIRADATLGTVKDRLGVDTLSQALKHYGIKK